MAVGFSPLAAIGSPHWRPLEYGPPGTAPFGLGSGKFGTPCERMQTTNLSSCE